MAEPTELKKITGYVRGGCSPFAQRRKYPLYVSESACNKEYICVSAGKIGEQIKINPWLLRELENCIFGDITV